MQNSCLTVVDSVALLQIDGIYREHILEHFLPISKQTPKPRAVVVAQLAERLLPIPEVRGSNPVFGKILQWKY